MAIFNKISYGYDAEKLKTFGKKPTADIYIDHVEYDSTFDNCAPVSVHTIIIFYMKGANDVAYLKTTELHDLLMQKFLTDEDWKILPGTSASFLPNRPSAFTPVRLLDWLAADC